MLITDAFLGEHAILYLLFQDIEPILPGLDSVAALRNRVAPLACSLESHAHLEDELLFAALEPYLGTHGGPLAVMRMEHDQIEHLLACVYAASDLTSGRACALQMIEVSRAHFQKEERVLFQIAQQMLGKETLSALGATWATRRGLSSIRDTP